MVICEMVRPEKALAKAQAEVQSLENNIAAQQAHVDASEDESQRLVVELERAHSRESINL